jgi:uncharacterized protein (DUF1499 family)
MHRMPPYPLVDSAEKVQTELVDILNQLPRTKIVTNEPGYIYVEFQTAIMMYTDDVEFLFDEKAEVIHFRSASRLGMGDFGLNRRRMEQIRAKLVKN